MFGLSKSKSQRDAQERFDTIIGSTTEVHGRVVPRTSLRIDGKVIGSIEAGAEGSVTVAIGKAGVVSGNITAHRVVVAGKVEGNIYAAERVELRKDSVVQGDITYGSIEVEHGARLLGALIQKTVTPAPAASSRSSARTAPERS